MNNQKNIITNLSLVLMLLFPLLSFAMPESGETITRRGVINDDYYAAGGTVDINAIISGDAVVAGGDLFIGHHVKGDVMLAGGSVHIRGDIEDDVRTAGGDITIDANIGDDLIASGGRINVSAGSSIGGDAWLAGGDVFVSGTVNKDLVIGAGNIRLSGIVHGDVRLEGGQIQILEGAVINGTLHYRSPNEANIDSAAKISGKISYEQIEWDHSQRGAGIFFFFITMTIASIVLFKLFPGFTMSAVARITSDPLKSLGAGLLILIIAPVLAVLLISIVLGIWLGMSILALYFVTLLLGFLVACFFVGNWGAKRLHKDVSTTGRRLLSVSIAILFLTLIKLIPMIGGLLLFVLLLLGLGAVILQLKDSYSQSGNV